MNFDLTEEQQILVDSVQRFVQNDSGTERFRKLRETERGWEPAMWERMAEYGWLGVVYPEEQGGFGGTFVDLALILESSATASCPSRSSRRWCWRAASSRGSARRNRWSAGSHR